MPELKYIPGFTFPNWHPTEENPENSCDVCIGFDEKKKEINVYFFQLNQEYMEGTSAINQAEIIATKIVNEVFPELFKKERKLRNAKVNWYVQIVTGTARYDDVVVMDINFDYPPRWKQTAVWEVLAGREPIKLKDFKFGDRIPGETFRGRYKMNDKEE